MSPRISVENRQAYLQDRREQILDAAMLVFGEKGYDGSNVADIAKAAKIGKGTIYLYFKSKEEIFNAILTERSFIPQLSSLTIDLRMPYQEVLEIIIENYLNYVGEHLPIMRMAFSEAYRFPAQGERLYRQIILKGSELLAKYLIEQEKAGKIRKLEDPLLTSQAIMGMMAAYFYTQEFLGGKNVLPISREAWGKEVYEILLHGIQPKNI
jgi:AcrR family transcriptional regulator